MLKILNGDLVEMSAEEEAEHVALSAAADLAAHESAATDARSERNRRISASDWTQLSDAPLTDAQKEAWVGYRQALRDVPAQDGFPENINWPETPAP